jgi:hypothetical protein
MTKRQRGASHEAKLFDGSTLARRPNGEIVHRRQFAVRQVISWGCELPEDTPRLEELGLPDDMTQAIEYFRNAKASDSGSSKWIMHAEVLRRYAQESLALKERKAELAATGRREMVSADRIADAFVLATRLHEERPRLKRSKLLELVAEQTGIGLTTLSKHRVGWLELPPAG